MEVSSKKSPQENKRLDMCTGLFTWFVLLCSSLEDKLANGHHPWNRVQFFFASPSKNSSHPSYPSKQKNFKRKIVVNFPKQESTIGNIFSKTRTANLDTFLWKGRPSPFRHGIKQPPTTSTSRCDVGIAIGQQPLPVLSRSHGHIGSASNSISKNLYIPSVFRQSVDFSNGELMWFFIITSIHQHKRSFEECLSKILWCSGCPGKSNLFSIIHFAMSKLVRGNDFKSNINSCFWFP